MEALKARSRRGKLNTAQNVRLGAALYRFRVVHPPLHRIVTHIYECQSGNAEANATNSAPMSYRRQYVQWSRLLSLLA